MDRGKVEDNVRTIPTLYTLVNPIETLKQR